MATTANPNLRPCPDCDAMVSRRAESCPQCGAPLTEPPEAEPEVKPVESPLEINAEFSAASRIPQQKPIRQGEINRTFVYLGFVLVGGLLMAIGIGISVIAEVWWLPFLMTFILIVSAAGFAIVEMKGRSQSKGGRRSSRRSHRPAKPVSAKDKYRG